MTYKSLFRFKWLCFAALALLLASYLPALAQTPTPPTPRDALIQAIQARAQRDVELGKPPEDIAGLQVLFGAEAASAGLTMAEVVEVYEMAYQAARPVKPWWDPLRPLLTGAGLLALAYVVFDKLLKDYLTQFVTWLGRRAYIRLAGFRPFWGVALDKYRRALVGRYERLNIPFRPGRPLEMREVYVPLKVQGARDTDLIEADRAVADHKWLMITGAPGAGKTMLLRRLALRYAEGGLDDFPTRPTPVLLELSRLSGSSASLETHLAQALKDNDFPGGERFIAAGLEHGMLLLLFDGLDEVASDARGRVARQIKDMLRANPAVRAVITCRTAVYNNEFADLVEQHLEIAPFSDQQIQRFLSAWQPQMPPGKSVEHLLRNLRERPHIMGLARNPLLLTIIAYLYTDTPFELPHSRTAFYDQSLTVLLNQWDHTKGVPNVYTATEKRLALQHLALVLQESPAQDGRDRRSLDLPTVLAEIARVLPSVSRKADDARPLLDEIVARSGLLLALDGGRRYQFAHLTLQEFLVAQKLQDDAAGLFTRYQADPDAWREPVKLWCGLAHDSTWLIQQLYAHDPIMAFECLGDAQQVEAALADRIIMAFYGRLGEDGEAGEAVTRAFAVVATNPQTRGQQVFDLLTVAVKESPLSPRNLAATQALALSNLPRAAMVLLDKAHRYIHQRELLVQMGDLATPYLAEKANQGHIWAIDALQTVGTPDAAWALVDLLWDKDERQSCYAAWQLAILLRYPNIETALRDFPLSTEQRKAPYLDWLWVPFAESADSSLSVIAGRIGYWLEKALHDPAPPELPSYELDPRLIVPLCALTPLKLKAQLESDKELPEAVATAADALLPPTAESVSKSDKENRLKVFHGLLDSLQAWFEPVPTYSRENLQRLAVLLNALIDLAAPCKALRLVLQRLPLQTQLKIIRSQTAEHNPTQDDWRTLFQPSKYDFGASWHALGFKVLTALLIILNVWHVGETVVNVPQVSSWGNAFNVLSGLGLIVAGLWLARRRWTLNGVKWIFILLGLGGGAAMGAVVGMLSDNWLLGAVLGAVLGTVGGAIEGAMEGAVLGAMIGAIGGAMGGTIELGWEGGMMYGPIIGAMLGTIIGAMLYWMESDAVVDVVIGAVLGAAFGAVVVTVVVAVFVAVASAMIYGPSSLIYDLWGTSELIAFWCMWLLTAIILYQKAQHRQRAAENPLHGLLPGTEPATTTPIQRRWLAFLPKGMALPMHRPRGKRSEGKQ